jgi:hypothetical protein
LCDEISDGAYLRRISRKAALAVMSALGDESEKWHRQWMLATDLHLQALAERDELRAALMSALDEERRRAEAYDDAVRALAEIDGGAPLSTTIGYLIRSGVLRLHEG